MSSPRHRPILLVTRSWHGNGGMQRLSRDLFREAEAAYGSRAIRLYPSMKGVWGLLSLCVRSVTAAVRLRGSDPRIHLCDASLLPLGWLLQGIAGGRLSVTACGLDVTYDAGWYRRLLRRFLNAADRYVAISAATADELRARGVEGERIVIIPCGVGFPAGAPAAANPHLLLTVGRLIPRKGVAWFAEHALPLVLQELPDARYVIIGAGPEEARIRRIIGRLDLDASVEMKTDCSDAERDALLARAALFVAPNISVPGDMEGFGIACIEAAARGTPVVAARLEGLKDAVTDPGTGRFFESEDAGSCADAVLTLLRDPPDRAGVARAARERYAWEVVFPLYRRHVFEV